MLATVGDFVPGWERVDWRCFRGGRAERGEDQAWEEGRVGCGSTCHIVTSPPPHSGAGQSHMALLDVLVQIWCRLGLDTNCGGKYPLTPR